MAADLKEAWASLTWAAKAADAARIARERGADPSRQLRDAKEHGDLAMVEINRAIAEANPHPETPQQ